MTDKTKAQIEEMKKQTFGVEVEMYDISRQKAAQVAAAYFGTNNYAYTANRNGYRTWSAWDQEGREWKFQRDSSIRAACDDEKCELVTPILVYKDMPLLQELIRQLRHAGAKSNPQHTCGIHIHVGAAGHTARTLRNLVNLMASKEDLIIKALYIDRYRVGTFCKMVDPEFLQRLNEEKPQTMDKLADIWYETQAPHDDRNAHYNDSRYHMLNLHATFTKGTVEFRLFQFNNPHGEYKGGLHAGRLKAYIQFCLAVSQMAKQSRTCNPAVQQRENPKFAMRTWLIRCGFVGPEFNLAMKFFTQNLPGNAAWRRNIA